MILALVALVTVESLLGPAREFAKRTGIDMPNTATNAVTTGDHGQTVSITIENTWQFMFWGGEVKSYEDKREPAGDLVAKGSPLDIEKWSKMPQVITEEEAINRAEKMLVRMGIQRSDYVVHEVKVLARELSPTKITPLPFVLVALAKKGPSEWVQASAVVSLATGNVIVATVP